MHSRITVFILVFFLSFSWQHTFSQQHPDLEKMPPVFKQNISISMKNVPFENFIDKFISETGIKLNYNRSRISLEQQISIEMKNTEAIAVLRNVMEQTGTALKIISGDQYVIIPKSDNENLYGKIRGRIVDIDNQRPLIGANVLIEEYKIGAATNLNGDFVIDKVPVGNYTLRLSYIGYQSEYIPDIIVKSKRTLFLDYELKETPLVGEPVIIRDNYFSDIDAQPVSATSFSSEEIRRTATFAGDITRIVSVLPGASIENEGNHLVVRGGSTIENKFYIDNIEVPNINHLPVMGTTGGFYSVTNLDFVRSVDFNSGGFKSNYGNSLSSVMNIELREGNREENDFQFDLNVGGISGQGEGPIDDGKGSWMLSARHNFSDIVLMLQNETNQSVKFNDVQGKLVYNISPEHELSILNIFSNDDFNENKNYAFNNYLNWYGGFKSAQNVAGINWKFLWSENGYSNTTISHIYRNEDVSLYTAVNESQRLRINSSESILQIKNDNFYRFNDAGRVEFGFDLKLSFNDLNNFYTRGLDLFGNAKPELRIVNQINTFRSGGFLSFEWIPFSSLSITPGVRLDHYDYNNNLNLSPRLSLTYRFSESTSITGSGGIYYQNLPFYILSQSEEFKNLKTPFAYHAVLSFSHLFADDLKLTIELYKKLYRDLPVDPNLYSLYLLDEALIQLFYDNHETLVSKGSGEAEGIEIMLQKKLSDNFYGAVSLSFLGSRYRDLNGAWRKRIVDTDLMFAFEGGYKLDREWEFSIRFNYSGGLRYTPFDINKSIARQSSIMDINKINALRFPDFNILSVRVDKRFHFTGSNLIVYFSVWNIFDRVNETWNGWSEVWNTEVEYDHFSIAPIFGIEFEF